MVDNKIEQIAEHVKHAHNPRRNNHCNPCYTHSHHPSTIGLSTSGFTVKVLVCGTPRMSRDACRHIRLVLLLSCAVECLESVRMATVGIAMMVVYVVAPVGLLVACIILLIKGCGLPESRWKGRTSSWTLSSVRLLFPLYSICGTPEFALSPDLGFASSEFTTIVSNLNSLPLLDDCIDVEHTVCLLVLLVGDARTRDGVGER